MRCFAAVICTAFFLAGCASDPLATVPRLSDTDISNSDILAAIRSDSDADEAADVALAPAPEPARRGLLGRFLSRPAPADPAPPAAGPDDNAETAEAVSPDEEIAPTATALVSEADADMSVPTAEPRRGLLGFLSRAALDAQDPQAPNTTDIAAIPPQTQNDAPARGLFGGNRPASGPKSGDPDYEIVSMGTVLPYGTLARVCDVPVRELGQRVDRYPESRSVYTLYDTEPGSTAPHTFYVTGFDDGCARQFTAAMALFGSPETHERLRYGLPSKVQPYSATDAAYEKVKATVCRVGRGAPCGSSMSRLARDTVFVSVYERFGSNPIWKTILLHDGAVVETDIRGN
ncbi:MAG: hypothetical protein ACSHXH_01905 [Marivita sp.]|uniref:hypothetical protein n=1 Tax=Marivita sp. TaxID=2003365 RepID=UPI003EF9A37E